MLFGRIGAAADHFVQWELGPHIEKLPGHMKERVYVRSGVEKFLFDIRILEKLAHDHELAGDGVPSVIVYRHASRLHDLRCFHPVRFVHEILAI